MDWDEPIWANMDICSRHQQRANTEVHLLIICSFCERGMEESFFCPNAPKSGLIMRSDHCISTESSVSFVSLTANVIITLHMLRRLRETLDTGGSHYYLPDIALYTCSLTSM